MTQSLKTVLKNTNVTVQESFNSLTKS